MFLKAWRWNLNLSFGSELEGIVSIDSELIVEFVAVGSVAVAAESEPDIGPQLVV